MALGGLAYGMISLYRVDETTLGHHGVARVGALVFFGPMLFVTLAGYAAIAHTNPLCAVPTGRGWPLLFCILLLLTIGAGGAALSASDTELQEYARASGAPRVSRGVLIASYCFVILLLSVPKTC